jgi:hypothetical protein
MASDPPVSAMPIRLLMTNRRGCPTASLVRNCQAEVQDVYY